MAKFTVLHSNNQDVFVRQAFRDAMTTAKSIGGKTAEQTIKQAERQSEGTVLDNNEQKVVKTTSHVVAPIGDTANHIALMHSYKRLAAKEIERMEGVNTDALRSVLSKYADVKGTETSGKYTTKFNTDALLSKTVIPAKNIELQNDYTNGLIQNGMYMRKVTDFKSPKSGSKSTTAYKIIDLRKDTSSTSRAFRLMAAEEMRGVLSEEKIDEVLQNPFSKERVKTRADFATEKEFQKYAREYKVAMAWDLRKQAGRLDDVSKTTAKALKKRKINLRLVEDVYQGSETMQGYNIARSGSGVVTATASGATAIGCYTAVHGYRLYNAVKMTKEFLAKELEKGVTYEWSEAFKMQLSEFDTIHGTEGVKIGGNNSATKLIKSKIRDRVKTVVENKITLVSKKEGMFQNAAKQWVDASHKLKDPIVGIESSMQGNTLTKITLEAIKTGAENTLKTTKAGTVVWNAASAPFKAFEMLNVAIEPVKNAIGTALSTILTPIKWVIKILFGALVALFVVSVILNIIAVVEKYFEAYSYAIVSTTLGQTNAEDIFNMLEDDSDLSGLESTMNEKLKHRGTKIMNTLDNSHDAFMAQLNDIRAKYDTTDTQYPSGSMENYKEIFCAAEVMCNFDFDTVTDEELQGWVNDLYERTHIITEEPYDFQYADGTWGKACHIYVDIQRDEMLTYSAMEGVATGSGFASGNCPKGTVVNADWMNVVKTLKTLIAQTNASYNQGGDVSICVNDAIYSVRTDCSGYVSACLWASGASPVGTNWNSQGLFYAEDKGGIPGFIGFKWSGWDVLQEGDIIAYGENGKRNNATGQIYHGWSGHTEIFSHNANGKHYVYSNGSTNSLRSASPTVAGNHGYNSNNTYVWRPINPGSSSTTLDVAGAVAVTMDFAEYFETPFYDNGSAVIMFSNQAGVTFNEETGNEDGYETALATTINAEMASTQFFTTGRFDAYNNIKAHTLDKDTTSSFVAVSSYDFVRYIAAKHGVTLPLDYFEGNVDTLDTTDNRVTMATMKPGDILFYLPLTTEMKDVLKHPLYEYGPGSEQYDAILNTIIPMIYCGDGMVAAYSRDVLQQGENYDTSIAQIRKYNVSSLNNSYVFDIVRPIGYTIAETYGANGTFAGWNDENIKKMIYLLREPQWETGIATKGFAEDLGGAQITLDYTPFYYEELNEGDYYDFTNAHSNTFKHDVLMTALKFYNECGILPSTAYTHSFIVSENRSTEESLLYYNIFEKYTVNEETGTSSTKYTYDSDGDVTSKDYLYKKYDSYEAAYRDLWNEFMNGKEAVLNKTTFSDQLHEYARYSVLNNDVRSKMQQVYYISSNTDLSNWDELAVKRKEAIDLLKERVKLLTNSLPNMYHNTSSEYYYLNKLIKITQESYNNLTEMLSAQNSSTPFTDEICAQAQNVLTSANSLSEAKWNWYWNNRYSEQFFISATCHGHWDLDYDPDNEEWDEDLQQWVPDPWIEVWDNCGFITNYNTYINCPKSTATFEEWLEGHCAD